jgi:hypothetical protein
MKKALKACECCYVKAYLLGGVCNRDREGDPGEVLER